MKMRGAVSKVLIGLLFGVLILSFAIWGIGDIFRGGGANTAVAEIGSRAIDQREFANSYNRELARLRQQFGGRLEPEQAVAFGLPEQVLQQIINRAAVEEQARKMGMAVSDDLVRERIRNDSGFQNALGDFDRNRFQQVLFANNLTEEGYIAALRGDIQRQQLIQALSSGVSVPSTLSQDLYRYLQEERVAETVMIRNDSIAELPEPSEDDLKAVFEDFAAEFQAPEYRALTVIYLAPEDLASEVAVSEEEISLSYEERLSEFTVPERRQIEQIVFTDEEAAAKAKERIDGGEDYATVSEAVTGQAPLDLGLIAELDLLAELTGPAFAMEVGGISEVVQSPLGWHILRVNHIEPGKTPSLDEVREELRHALARTQALDAIVSVANQLDDEVAGGASLEDAAAALGLTAKSIAAIDEQGNDPEGNIVEGLPPGNEFLPVAFETEAGEESLLRETLGGGYFIVRVDGTTPAATRPFETVRDDVVQRWQAETRDRLAEEKAEALLERAKLGETLAVLAEEAGLSVVTSQPLNRFGTDPNVTTSPNLASEIFQIKEGEFAVVSTPTGHLVARVTKIEQADPSADEAALANVADQVKRSLEAEFADQFVGALRQDLGVSVNRALLDQLVTGY